MERGSITKWLLLGVAVVLFWTIGKKQIFGSKASELQPFGGIRDDSAQVAEPRPGELYCDLEGPRFKAEISSRGASLRHLVLTDKRFDAVDGDRHPKDLVSSATESRAPLRTDLKLPLNGDGKQQVAFDDLDWKLVGTDGKSCTFTYADATTSLKKTISTTGKPYELAVQVDVQNLAPEAKKHRFTIEEDAWRTRKEVEGGFMKRQSEHASDVLAVTAQKTERQLPGDFEPSDFSKPEFTAEKWRRAPGEGKLAAVSSVYFTDLLVPEQGAGAPAAETQIEQRWDRARHPTKEDDPSFGYLYRARLAYPEKELAPQETVTYKTLAYAGPKDRVLLAAVDPHATDVINLGYFTYIANWLVRYLHAIYGVVGSWGVAIVVLTVTVRLVLFPLSLSQIKSSMAMRKLKPEMDLLNEKYKDDAAQKGLAIQELWRKNNVSNPVIGCLPMLLQMPVWWALYSVLQTAVQLYHVPFLWFGDLTAPDKFFIIPIVLGASSFFQQKLMPAQGDPQQQKMMQYMMPGIFVFMMLFLPAGLGVYMLTNSVLAIGQQLLVERYLKGHGAGPSAQIEVREKSSGDGDKPKPALGRERQVPVDNATPAEAGLIEATATATATDEQRPPREAEEQDREPFVEDGRADVALDFTIDVLAAMGMDCTVDLLENDEEDPPEDIRLEIEGKDAGRVIGKKGQTLQSLQFLANRVVNRPGKPRRHVIVDAEGYRARREDTLTSMARRLGKQAVDEGKIITFEPMNPQDRRVVHLALAKFPGVVTKSDGEGEARRVQIIPVRR